MADFFKVATIQGNSLFDGTPRKAAVVEAALARLLRQIWEDGAAKFAEKVAETMIVETGESAGSLEPLARATKAMLSFSGPKGGRERPSLHPITGKPIPGTKRSFATGVQAGRTAFRFDFSRNNILFEFDIPVFQFAVHETGRAFGSTTKLFGALDRGVFAMRAHILREYRRRAPAMISSWILTGKAEERALGDF